MKTLFAVSLALTAFASGAGAACAVDTVTVLGDFGRARFAVDVADDEAERAQGLMYVEEMGRFEGMLFVYEAPRPASFWMRNTLIPLDETPIFGGDEIAYVLEINGGMAARLGIAPGDVLQHPAIGPEPAAPCE